MTDDGLMASRAVRCGNCRAIAGWFSHFWFLPFRCSARARRVRTKLSTPTNAILAATDTAAARVQSFAGRHAPFHAECAVASPKIAGKRWQSEPFAAQASANAMDKAGAAEPAQLSLMARISEFLGRDFGGRGRRSLSESPAAVTRPGRSRIADSTAPSPRTRTPSSIEPAGPRNRPASGERRPPSS